MNVFPRRVNYRDDKQHPTHRGDPLSECGVDFCDESPTSIFERKKINCAHRQELCKINHAWWCVTIPTLELERNRTRDCAKRNNVESRRREEDSSRYDRPYGGNVDCEESSYRLLSFGFSGYAFLIVARLKSSLAQGTLRLPTHIANSIKSSIFVFLVFLKFASAIKINIFTTFNTKILLV